MDIANEANLLICSNTLRKVAEKRSNDNVTAMCIA